MYCEEPALAITIPVWYDEDGNRKNRDFCFGRGGVRGAAIADTGYTVTGAEEKPYEKKGFFSFLKH